MSYLRKRLLCVVVFLCIVSLLLSACENTPVDSKENKPTSVADTEGKYISGERVGNLSDSIRFGNKVMECTNEGVYYFQESPVTIITEDGESRNISSEFLYFSQHGSNTMIRLCGRPDCDHNNLECNAAFYEIGCTVSSYEDHIYVVGMLPGTFTLFNVYRLDPDGSNREKILDGLSMNTKGYQICDIGNIINGVLVLDLLYLDADGTEQHDCYYYKLDGSMTEPMAMESIPLVQDGDTMFVLDNSFADTDPHSYICKWDPDTNTKTRLFDIANRGIGAWGSVCCSENAIYFVRNGAVTRIKYGSGAEEVLFETGLQNVVHTHWFSDYIVIVEDTNDESINPLFHIYNWDGVKQGELEINFPHGNSSALIVGETHERILLNPSWNNLPKYYIEKSDFGTGTIELHEIQYPDVDAAEYERLFRVSD